MNSKIIIPLIAVLFVAGCASTTQNNTTQSATPSISIISPMQGQTVTVPVTVQLSASNIKLAPATGSVVDGEGHFHVWIDDKEQLGAKTTFIFDNVAPGQHTIKAELHRGDHSDFSPPVIVTITITVSASGTIPPVSTIAVKEFNVTAQRFSFSPSTITVNKGDHVVLNLLSTDVTHGLELDAFNIIETLPPGETKTVQFDADKAGSFPFFCSVFCGSGHSSMRGMLVVNP